MTIPRLPAYHEETGRQGRMTRPYAVTRGRTQAAEHLPLETIVVTTTHGHLVSHRLAQDERAVARLCVAPLSIAEVSAHLALPLGVIKILVADLHAAGLVDVSSHDPDNDRPDVRLLERVLDGIRSL